MYLRGLPQMLSSVLEKVENSQDLTREDVIKKIADELKVQYPAGYEEWKNDGFKVDHIFSYDDGDYSVDYTLFYIAATNGYRRVTEFLVESGADVNHIADGDTALRLLAQPDAYDRRVPYNTEIVQFLIERGANVNAESIEGWAALHWAADSGYAEIVEILLDSGANVNAVERINGFTALHCAAWKGHLEVVIVLLREGANISATSSAGTPLHLAVMHGHLDIVEMLLREGANSNIRDEDGNAPLCFAVKNSDAEIAELLINNGADVNVRNNEGRTFLHKVSN